MNMQTTPANTESTSVSITTRINPSKAKKRIRKPYKPSEWVITLFARVLRYLAGRKNHYTGSPKYDFKPIAVLSPATQWAIGEEMERRRWVRKEFSGRRVTYKFLRSFPVPPNYFNELRRHLFDEIVSWGGSRTSAEMAWLVAAIRLLSPEREYGGDRAHLAQEINGFAEDQVSGAEKLPPRSKSLFTGNRVTYIARKLAKKEHIQVLSNHNEFRFRLAGPSGRIPNVVNYPERRYEAEAKRRKIIQYIEHRQGEEIAARSIAKFLGCDVGGVWYHLRWLEEKLYIRVKHRANDEEKGNTLSEYRAVRDLDGHPISDLGTTSEQIASARKLVDHPSEPIPVSAPEQRLGKTNAQPSVGGRPVEWEADDRAKIHAAAKKYAGTEKGINRKFCEALDFGEVPLSSYWEAQGFGGWTKAYRRSKKFRNYIRRLKGRALKASFVG
jgi:hypothetical protein